VGTGAIGNRRGRARADEQRVTKLVDDFPAALIYTCADLFVQRITQDRDDTKGLKRVRMDDTEFEFDTNTAASSAAGTLSDFNFSSIRGKMNLYRKVVFP